MRPPDPTRPRAGAGGRHQRSRRRERPERTRPGDRVSWEAVLAVIQASRAPGCDWTDAEFRLLINLAEHHNAETGRCDPGADLLARETDDNPGNVRRLLRQLERKQVIHRGHTPQWTFASALVEARSPRPGSGGNQVTGAQKPGRRNAGTSDDAPQPGKNLTPPSGGGSGSGESAAATAPPDGVAAAEQGGQPPEHSDRAPGISGKARAELERFHAEQRRLLVLERLGSRPVPSSNGHAPAATGPPAAGPGSQPGSQPPPSAAPGTAPGLEAAAKRGARHPPMVPMRAGRDAAAEAAGPGPERSSLRDLHDRA